MKIFIVCALLFFAANPAIKPDGKREQRNGKANGSTESPIVVIDNRSTTEKADQGQNKASWCDASVWANWALVAVGIATFIAVWKQAKETAKATQAIGDQSRIANNALIASNRPLLRVKHVFIIPDKNTPGSPNTDSEWKFSCIVANVGGSKANVFESSLTARLEGVGPLENLLPSFPPYETKYSFGSFILEPSDRQERIVKLGVNEESMTLRQSHQIASTREKWDKPKLTTAPKVFFGYFRYRDDRGVARITGFGCTWDSSDLSCTRLQNPSYDYED
jgi:hypothetical protein